jgi:hypothetical protein
MIAVLRKFSVLYQREICKVLFISEDPAHGLAYGVAKSKDGSTGLAYEIVVVRPEQISEVMEIER